MSIDEADRFAKTVLPIIASIQRSGITSLRGLAIALNNRGVRTARGGQWQVSNVRNLLARCNNQNGHSCLYRREYWLGPAKPHGTNRCQPRTNIAKSALRIFQHLSHCSVSINLLGQFAPQGNFHLNDRSI